MILDFILKNKRFLKYAVSGTINTLITLISYNIFIRLDVNYILANFIAYCLGVLNGFVLNKRWVFKSNGKIRVLLPKFITVNVMSLTFSSMLLFFLVNGAAFNKIAAQLTATMITGIFNYTMNRLWTFS